MNELIWCRTCTQWETTSQWRGNCKVHPWDNDRWSQDAEPNDECKKANLGKGDFVDRLAKYQGVK